MRQNKNQTVAKPSAEKNHKINQYRANANRDERKKNDRMKFWMRMPKTRKSLSQQMSSICSVLIQEKKFFTEKHSNCLICQLVVCLKRLRS